MTISAANAREALLTAVDIGIRGNALAPYLDRVEFQAMEVTNKMVAKAVAYIAKQLGQTEADVMNLPEERKRELFNEARGLLTAVMKP